MKKLVYLFLLIIVIVGIGLFVLNFNSSSSAKSDIQKNTEIEKNVSSEPEILEIKEKMFIAQLSDIYVNPKSYDGKKIKFEGFIYNFENGCVVLRRTPGCCGNDGVIGLEIKWDKPYPKDDVWVEAIGIIKLENREGVEEPIVYLSELNEKEERGLDFVTQ